MENSIRDQFKHPVSIDPNGVIGIEEVVINVIMEELFRGRKAITITEDEYIKLLTDKAGNRMADILCKAYNLAMEDVPFELAIKISILSEKLNNIGRKVTIAKSVTEEENKQVKDKQERDLNPENRKN
jgi:hypothetical protein